MSTLDQKIVAYVDELGQRAKAAAGGLLTATTDQKNDALRKGAANLRAATDELVAANKKDVEYAKEAGKPDSFIDRLMLNEERIEGMAKALEDIAELPDPVGRKLAEFNRPNGLRIERVAVPLGVIGMIYESRPNVGSDASALCLKSGNAVILRGGSDSRNSTKVIVDCLARGLKAAGLPEHALVDADEVAEVLADQLGVDADVRRGAVDAARGLVHHDARMRGREALAGGAGREQELPHRRRHAHRDRGDVGLDELHRVVDRHARGDRATGRVDVEVDVLLGVFGGEKEDLRADLIRVLVTHLRPEPDDAVSQQLVEDARRDKGFSGHVCS